VSSLDGKVKGDNAERDRNLTGQVCEHHMHVGGHQINGWFATSLHHQLNHKYSVGHVIILSSSYHLLRHGCYLIQDVDKCHSMKKYT